jgi:hypothetical protein
MLDAKLAELKLDAFFVLLLLLVNEVEVEDNDDIFEAVDVDEDGDSAAEWPSLVCLLAVDNELIGCERDDLFPNLFIVGFSLPIVAKFLSSPGLNMSFMKNDEFFLAFEPLLLFLACFSARDDDLLDDSL